MRKPRDYQLSCTNAIQAAFRSGKRGVAIEAFTGFGKGFVIADIARQTLARKKRVLVLVNRDNLVEQLHASLCEQGLHPMIERGLDCASKMSQLVIGSIQTLQKKRLASWPRDSFNLIICDEVHGAGSSTFKNTLTHFESSYHLGCSATIERHDRKGLWKGYEEVCFRMSLQEGVDAGWLVPFEFEELPVPIKVSDELATKRTFTEEDEAGLFDQNEYLPRLFNESAARVHESKALMFWPNCKSSEEASTHFKKCGIESRHIDGYQPDAVQKATLAWFATPGPKVLHNADLLSYGYDNPSIDCVGIMRLSRSIPMLKQRLGRGTRALCPVDLYPTPEERKQAIADSEKPKCRILDLMIQLGDVKHTFADATALITDDEQERAYLREERAKPGVKFTAEELANKLKVKREVDEEKALAKLAEDAANAALKANSKRSGPYLEHILRQPVRNGWSVASSKQMDFLRRLNYNGVAPSGWHAHRIIEAILEHRKK